MEPSTRRIRSAVRQLAQGKAPQTVRYPTALREAAVTVTRRRQGAGHSLARIARELGVSAPTLAGWLRPHPAAVLRPVAVAPEPAPMADAARRLVLTTAHGLRVEGLERADVIAILRALA